MILARSAAVKPVVRFRGAAATHARAGAGGVAQGVEAPLSAAPVVVMTCPRDVAVRRRL
jgi:hypothetical protein